jgi:hypothetical protein
VISAGGSFAHSGCVTAAIPDLTMPPNMLIISFGDCALAQESQLKPEITMAARNLMTKDLTNLFREATESFG